MNPRHCPRCNEALAYAGQKKFHEGSRGWKFFLGDRGELFVNRPHSDESVCQHRGRVEFSPDGIGEEVRPH